MLRLTCMRLHLLVPLLLLAACGSATPGDEVDGERADNDLVVQLDLGDGTPPQRWTLTCAGSAQGNHPQAQAACEHLSGLEEPFAPLPADVLCTQVYGGPQTAQVTGVWGGQPVDLALSRTDGCRIGQWDALVPLVPAAS